ncbi:MAG: hypothetical protein HY718_07005 [Planctomycetes bacterium]|nr:hypothetical protein [Planctomycetota bacterium]
MSVNKHSSKGKVRRVGLSDRTKKVLLATTGCVALVLLSFWAYYTFTTLKPPDLATARPQEVVNYLGLERGFPRMGIDDREQYLVKAYNKFAQGEARIEMSKAFERMSAGERQVFVDAAFEAAKVRFLQKANEYNRLPKGQRTQFVDSMINTLETQRRSVGGYGGQGDVTAPFKGSVPNTTDGMTKTLVSRTTASQRAKAQPLFDAIAVRYKEREKRR